VALAVLRAESVTKTTRCLPAVTETPVFGVRPSGRPSRETCEIGIELMLRCNCRRCSPGPLRQTLRRTGACLLCRSLAVTSDILFAASRDRLAVRRCFFRRRRLGGCVVCDGGILQSIARLGENDDEVFSAASLR